METHNQNVLGTIDFYKGHPRAEKYLELRRGTPEDLAANFRWAEYLNVVDHFKPDIEAACDKTKNLLHMEPDNLFYKFAKADQLSRDCCDRFLFPDTLNKADIPNYHEKVHGEVSGTVAAEAMIFAVNKLANNPKFKKHFEKDPKLAEQIIGITKFIGNIHELDDWWKQLGVNPSEALGLIRANMGIFGLNEDDINKMIVLDDFIKPVKGEFINKIYEGEIGKKLFDDGNVHGDGFLARFKDDPAFAKAILYEMGICIRGADFMQSFNPAYLAEAIILDPDGSEIGKTNIGGLALAVEFEKFRPKAIIFTEWNRDDNPLKVDWKKVGIGPKYIRRMVDAIKPLMGYLRRFDKDGQYKNAKNILKYFKDKMQEIDKVAKVKP